MRVLVFAERVTVVTGSVQVALLKNVMVLALEESVTTTAGTFTCLKVHKTTSGQADKTYWFAKGVGKVQEMGEQRETLTAYSMP